MGVVDLLDEIGHRQLQLMQPEPVGLRTGAEFQLRPEKMQNLGDLRDHQFAGLEERRREGRAFFAPVHHRHHAVHAARLARNVIVGRAGILERQPHEFAAALDAGPVEQLIAHRAPR